MTTAPHQSTRPAAGATPSSDPLQLIDVDHVRFYCGNAKQAAYFYCHCFGFTCEQVCDQTTGSRDAAHYYLTQGNIRFILTSGLRRYATSSIGLRTLADGTVRWTSMPRSRCSVRTPNEIPPARFDA